MLQLPQTDQVWSTTGAAASRAAPVSEDRELISSAARAARFSTADSGLVRLAKADAGDSLSVTGRTPEADKAARNQGLTAELVRAETMFQIAQQATEAIAILYDGMQELAGLAVGENLTEDRRAELDASFQDLKQQIGDVIDATVFDGKKLLGGGDGPDGEFVVRIGGAGEDGGDVELFIPSADVGDRIEGLEDASLLSVEAAEDARAVTAEAARLFRERYDLAGEARTTLQSVYASEITTEGTLADYALSFGEPEYLSDLAYLVVDLIEAGQAEDPFANAERQLREAARRAGAPG